MFNFKTFSDKMALSQLRVSGYGMILFTIDNPYYSCLALFPFNFQL